MQIPHQYGKHFMRVIQKKEYFKAAIENLDIFSGHKSTGLLGVDFNWYTTLYYALAILLM